MELIRYIIPPKKYEIAKVQIATLSICTAGSEVDMMECTKTARGNLGTVYALHSQQARFENWQSTSGSFVSAVNDANTLR